MRFEDFFTRRRRPRPPRPQTVIARHIGKGIAAVIIAGGAALFGLKDKKSASNPTSSHQETHQPQAISENDENQAVARAVANSQELSFVEIKNAQIVKLLRADNRGARHQRWITRLSNGILITVSHNVDLAEKVPISPGDIVDMAGELVFNQKKQEIILHFTHEDPRHKRVGGYILHLGKKYGQLITK